jgi:hypothetical protein
MKDDTDRVSWLWRGYLAPGSVTLLTSQWKSGKTTLLSILLSRLNKGGELAGLAVAPARAVVLSEEPRANWRERHARLKLRTTYLICRPFTGKPSMAQWLALLDHVADLRRKHDVRLFVVDTLATFLPGRNEASAAVMLESLTPLQRLTQLGMSVLLVHHPGKGKPLPGQAARGSGALAGFVDIILEMNWCSHATENDRRRRLLAFSRHDETPRQLVIELNPEGTDYLTHGDFEADEFLQSWDRLRMVLEDASDKRTRRQILDEWPADFPPPSDITLWRWLQRAAALGLITQEGSGRRTDPFRYWLPSQEARWRADPLYEFKRRCEENNRDVQRLLENHRLGR